MKREEAVEVLRKSRAVAAVQVPGEQQLTRAVAALAEGGMTAVELPYAAVQSAGCLVQAVKEFGLLVGVGGITRSSHARESGMLGADFIAAAVTAPDVVAACREMDVLCILASLTPTEVWRAQEMEADLIKVQAEALGGPDYIRSLRETLSVRRLMAAEVPLDGYLSFLEAGVEALEFKSSLALPDLAEEQEWAEISHRASEISNACRTWKASRDRSC